ncbi:RHS repeat-associated core domain-containing protein [Chitinilyticum litopenaei]|uniref:RHS repeat-associated core domain-containing protein n=1 Tax=Chitinilyticum litopenaei TaxID=1121276 RepID=UPI00130D5021|nr:RHS repeat-associated core domain-containing protein [Chitinilyticum litopenaei]
MRSNDVDTEFAYDPLGRRLLKHSTPKLPIGAGAQAAVNPAWVASETARLSREHGYGVTLYGWDGDQIAWEGDAETTTHYVFEPGSFVPLLQAKTRQRIPLLPTPDWSERDYDYDADPLWTYSPEPQPFEQLYYYHTDHLGTPQELLDSDGNLAWSADYKAWGEAKAAISEAAKRAGISNPLRFQGQYYDHETGLHYNRHRYYDPGVGRFISKDPISLQGGLNIFAYAPNPVEWVDPLGLNGVYVFETSNGQTYVGKGERSRYLTSTRERTSADGSYSVNSGKMPGASKTKIYDASVNRGKHFSLNPPPCGISKSDYAEMVESEVMNGIGISPNTNSPMNRVKSPGVNKFARVTCPKARAAVSAEAARIIKDFQSLPAGSGRR